MHWFSNADLARLAGRICPAWPPSVQPLAVESAGGFNRKPTNTEPERDDSGLRPILGLASDNWYRICV